MELDTKVKLNLLTLDLTRLAIGDDNTVRSRSGDPSLSTRSTPMGKPKSQKPYSSVLRGFFLIHD